LFSEERQRLIENLRRAHRIALVLFGIASWIFAAYYCGLPFQISIAKVSMGFPAIAIGSGAFLLATIGSTILKPASALGRWLIYLGKISYGLYVYNPIATFTAGLILYRVLLGRFTGAGLPPWTAWGVYIVVAFGLNVGMAAVSYRLLEAPFLRLKERYARIPSRAV
jgi:peptidoglycan/LPS O-acetylase OafA/YrhL